METYDRSKMHVLPQDNDLELNQIGILTSRVERTPFTPITNYNLPLILEHSRKLFESVLSNNAVMEDDPMALGRERENAKPIEQIVVLLNGEAIGDALSSLGFPQAIQAGLHMLGIDIPMKYVVNPKYESLYEGLHNPPYTTVDSHLTFEKIREETRQESSNKTLVLDFNSWGVEENEAKIIEEGNMVAYLNMARAVGTEFPNPAEYGLSHKYGIFAEYFLGLTDSGIRIPLQDVQPQLPPPKDYKDTFWNMARDLGITLDRHTGLPTKKQIAIIVEASASQKRYPLEQWAEMIQERDRLLKERQKQNPNEPDEEYNIIFHDNYSKEEMDEVLAYLKRNPSGEISARAINRTLKDIASFLAFQNLVYSNDTGLAHYAALLKNGPFVITLFLPHFALWWRSTPKQIPQVQRGAESITVEETDYTHVHAIRPTDLAKVSEPGGTIDFVSRIIQEDMQS